MDGDFAMGTKWEIRFSDEIRYKFIMEIIFNPLPIVQIDEIHDLLSQAKGRGATNKVFWDDFEKGGLYFIATHPKVVFRNITSRHEKGFGPYASNFELFIQTAGQELLLGKKTVNFRKAMENEGWRQSVISEKEHSITLAQTEAHLSHLDMCIRPISQSQEIVKIPMRIEYIGEATISSPLHRAIIGEKHEGLTRTLVNKEADLNIPNDSSGIRFTRNMNLVVIPFLLSCESKSQIRTHAFSNNVSYETLKSEIIKDAEKVLIHYYKPKQCNKLYQGLLNDAVRVHTQGLNIQEISYSLGQKHHFYSDQNGTNKLCSRFVSKIDNNGELSLTPR